MQSQPLFIVGAPRSGTTFLCHALNQHPLIDLTNESRVFVWLKDIIEVRSRRPDLIGREFRERFADFVYDTAGEWIERFYRQGLGMTAPIWGDKHPPYADPGVLSRRNSSLRHLPLSGSCLRLIKRCLPGAKFIHIHRDPGQVAYSMARKRWVPSIEEGVRVWLQYVTEIADFFAEIDSGLSISYRDLLEEPSATAAAMGRFLDLPDWASIEAFLLKQHEGPIPFSEPVTDLSVAYRLRAEGHPRGRALRLAGQTGEQLRHIGAKLGYSFESRSPVPKKSASL